MLYRMAVFLTAFVVTCTVSATDLPQAFKKIPKARIAAMCAACMSLSAATMANLHKSNAKEIDVAMLLYLVWLDRAETSGAKDVDINWALKTLGKQSDQATLRQIGYCVNEGYKIFEALPSPKQEALMSEVDNEKSNLLKK